MPSLSNYLESGILNHLFRTGTFAKPAVIGVALCSGTIIDADTGFLTTKELGGGFPQVAGPGGYARQSITPSDANFSFVTQISNSGNTDNTTIINFGPATVDWGIVSHIALCDTIAYGGGNLLLHGPVRTPKLVQTGDEVRINIGNLDIFAD